MRDRIVVGVLGAILAASPAVAGEFVLTPNVGGAFGGNTDDTRITYGADLSYFGDGILGAELSFAYAPDFFGGKEGPPLPDNNLATLVGNLVLQGRLGDGRSRLYASGGIGLLQTRIDETEQFLKVDSNEFALNAGAGVLAKLSDHIGLRGDIRYFRQLTDPEPDNEFDVDLADLDFWRASVGVSIRF